jgi:hypothetical protein
MSKAVEVAVNARRRFGGCSNTVQGGEYTSIVVALKQGEYESV